MSAFWEIAELFWRPFSPCSMLFHNNFAVSFNEEASGKGPHASIKTSSNWSEVCECLVVSITHFYLTITLYIYLVYFKGNVCLAVRRRISFMWKTLKKKNKPECGSLHLKVWSTGGEVEGHNSHRRSRSLWTPLPAGRLSNADGRWPFPSALQTTWPLRCFWRCIIPPTVAFTRVSEAAHPNSDLFDEAASTSADVLHGWKCHQCIVPWQVHTGLSFLGAHLLIGGLQRQICIHRFLSGTSLDSRKDARKLGKVRKVVSVPAISSADVIKRMVLRYWRHVYSTRRSQLCIKDTECMFYFFLTC